MSFQDAIFAAGQASKVDENKWRMAVLSIDNIPDKYKVYLPKDLKSSNFREEEFAIFMDYTKEFAIAKSMELETLSDDTFAEFLAWLAGHNSIEGRLVRGFQTQYSDATVREAGPLVSKPQPQQQIQQGVD